MRYTHILVALERTDESKMLIDRASYIAELTNAYVSFVHIDGSHGEIYPELVDIQLDSEEHPLGEKTIKEIREFEAYSEQPIKHILVGTGDLAEKLQETITANHIDLLICGHHHDFWSKIASYSKHLVDKSPIDILVVPM
ncbi:universal stress protein A [Vibrio orientalis CIP 102891 = ATCC 33934]|uniref:Universal stress protein n=1 Tax=Vibrio orientalis CIP 102891 = ATCC 33934 TaxID=675816 RepID=C9QGE3_VIBOR|nr:universal stress protein [Vibrio orientalis]EEX94825.1 universal stress protein family 8 [Vibrio orientalis CIP 102891 = ATCC 33934]EGU53043.1 universal stress protein A [Vibrio orientalis CIP 102891 = ATCC 33934]